MERWSGAVLSALLMAGCPYVEPGEIRVEQGELPPAPGAVISLGLYCDGLFGGWELTAGPEHCGRAWEVDGVLGGNHESGTITDCGVYTAPAMLPAEPPVIIASECEWGFECADGCSAALALE